MKRPLLIFLFVIVGAIFSVFLLGLTAPKGDSARPPLFPTEDSRVPLKLRDALIFAEVVESDPERVRGLSGREHLADGEGMLFVFDADARHAFWMKDMNFPIDIIWFDSDFDVVHIEHSLSPSTYPETFTPPFPARYVLEVPAGFAKVHSIAQGDTLLILSKVQ